MQAALTVRDLLLPGEPLHPCEVAAGEGGLNNEVTWVVSLRPYPPAFPQLRGGELALVAVEHLVRLDPPATLVGVISYLSHRGASGVAVRGPLGEDAVASAMEAGLPLLRLLNDTPLQDIEQAVMRECALHQARREVQPQSRHAWVESLLRGRTSTLPEAQVEARRAGYILASHYTVAYLSYDRPDPAGMDELLQELEAAFGQSRQAGAPMPIAAPYEQGIAVLLPQGWEIAPLLALVGGATSCGIGREKPVLEAGESLRQAQLAALASTLLHGGAPTRYSDLGADRLLLLLYRDHRDELRAYVEETLGPLLRHDTRASTPLLPTVEAFIRHGGRLRETAAELYVHRNTLAYRLERAGGILGVDLGDVEGKFGVELALRALLLIKV